jgi:methylaspartate mutase sigma subunit
MKETLVTGVIGEDVHNIGMKVLEHAFKAAGYNVVSLGTRVPAEQFIEAAVETSADAILISSLSGHARALCEGFRDKCVEKGLARIKLYIGGHLVIGESKWEDTEKLFRDMGFDGVYPPTTLPQAAVEGISKDLEQKRR